MKRKFLSIVLAVCMVMTMIPAAFAEDGEQTAVQSDAWGSNYDTAESFSISSVEELQAFAAMVNEGKDFSEKTVALTSDLDLSNVTSWVPIGSLDILDNSWNSSDRQPFAGTFDGGNHTISNLKISSGTDDDSVCHDYTGLFGYVTGTVKNVILDNLSITAAYDYLGGIAGYLDSSGEIDNCTVSGTISGASFTNGSEQEAWGSYVGGVVGYSDGTVTDCTSNCQLNDVIEYVGGIVGLCETGTISSCTSNSEISDTLTTTYIGGIVGQLGASGYTKGGSVINCTNTGSLGAYAYSGGIVGCAYNSTISGCVNSGTITGNEWSTNSRENRRVAGIVGDTQGTTISNCTNTGTVDAEALQDVGGIVGLLYYGSTVTNCTNSGDITGGKNTGGIVGFAESYSTEGYEVTGCTNSGDVTGGTGVGGIVGVGTANDSVNGSNTKQIISDCVNSGEVSGEDNVGGIVGEHNSDVVNTASATSVATVSGCINTASVSATGENGSAGAIVGNNNDATKSSDTSSDTSGETKPGIVQNNFWPEDLNLSAVGSGVGSSDTETAETVKNNSSYKEDGTLTDSVTDENGDTVGTIAGVVDTILGGTENAPEVLKVTATFDTNGHGTAPSTQEVVIGTEITLPSMSNDGYYTFLYWTIQGDSSNTQYNGNAKYTITADTTFVANWRDDTPASTPSSGSSSSSTTYSVSVDTAKNGTVTVSPKNASKGTTVTITAKPADGYEVDEVIVTDKNGDTIKVTAKGNDKYTFTMPAGKVDVEVTFVKEYVAPAISFTDVKSNAWYYDAALYAAENGLMSGTGNGAFSPDLTTSRAMIWTILARVDGQNISVTYGNWYDKAQAWAISAGVSDGTNPDNPITREQLAVMLYGFAKDQGYTTAGGVSLSRYVDASDVSAWAVEALEWAVGNGLISSMGNNILAPTGTATRAQVAVILMNFCENIAK